MQHLTHGRLFQEGPTSPYLQLFGGMSRSGLVRFESACSYSNHAWRQWCRLKQLSPQGCPDCGRGVRIDTTSIPCTHPKGWISVVKCLRCGRIMAKVRVFSGVGGPWVFGMRGLSRLKKALEDIPRRAGGAYQFVRPNPIELEIDQLIQPHATPYRVVETAATTAGAMGTFAFEQPLLPINRDMAQRTLEEYQRLRANLLRRGDRF